jgi:hypothetical protein
VRSGGKGIRRRLGTLVEYGEQIEACGRHSRCSGGAEQSTGLPVMTITPKRELLYRHGLRWPMCRK